MPHSLFKTKIDAIEWIEVKSHQRIELETLAEEFKIHPLALEDCLHNNQRAKFEDFGTHQLLVWFGYWQEISYEFELVIFPKRIIFVTTESPPTIPHWFEFLQLKPVAQDSYHFAMHVLDRIADLTEKDLRQLFDKIEDFEEGIFNEKTDPRILMQMKRCLARAEFILAPLSSVANQVLHYLNPKDDLKWRWRDLIDHSERTQQSLVFYRHQISNAMETYWGFSGARANERIKKLTLLASISVPLTFWASFWGMNFTQLPFDKPWALGLALALMAVSGVVIHFILKFKGYWDKD